ncbi:hypothetical protein DY000_02055319 [Brassica cretica]|uniref:Uncharacterized protein n=1 Tax=Brassica cretica TaxID=69181 RepID=A0ABQ7AJM9_BRACR|nr:hypothetical protein DY000_02055319 [Brassica cretica]
MRLFWFWKARNVKKGGELMGFICNKSWSSYRFYNMYSFRNKVITCSVEWLYDLSGFEVTKTNQSFCLSDSPVSICFTDQTKFHELPESKGLIPMELFRKAKVCLSVFDKWFHGVEPQVIAATNVNSKLVGGRLFPNLASVTLLYFAGECKANTSCVKGGQEVCIDYLGTEFICPQLPSADNGSGPAVGDDVPFDESHVEDCGPLQRSHVMVELQKIEVKVGVLVSQLLLLLPLIPRV